MSSNKKRVARRDSSAERAARREAKRRVDNRKKQVDKSLSKARSDRKKAEAKAKHDEYFKKFKYEAKERVEKVEKKRDDTRARALANTLTRIDQANDEFNRKAAEIQQAVAEGRMNDDQADAALEQAAQEAKSKIDGAAQENLGVKPEDVQSDLQEKQDAIEQAVEEGTKTEEEADDETSANASQTEAEAIDLESDTGTVEEGAEDPDSVEGKLTQVEADLEDAIENAPEDTDGDKVIDQETEERLKGIETAIEEIYGWVDVADAMGSKSVYLNVKYDETGAYEAYISLMPIAPNGVEMHDRRRWESYLVGTVMDGEVTQQVMAGTFEVDARRSPTDDKSIDRVEPVGDANGEAILEIKGWQAQDSASPDTLADTLANGGTFEDQQVLVRSGKNGVLTYLPIGVLGGGGDSSDDSSEEPCDITIKVESFHYDGESDERGYTEVTLTPVVNGVEQTQDAHTFIVYDGYDGADGQDGVGIASIVSGDPQPDGDYTVTPVTVTLTNGQVQNLTVRAKNGLDGDDGKNAGVVISTSQIPGNPSGTRVTLTPTQDGVEDPAGAKSFDVMNGRDGAGLSQDVTVVTKVEYNEDGNHKLVEKRVTIQQNGQVVAAADRDITQATPCDCGGGGDSSEEPGGGSITGEILVVGDVRYYMEGSQPPKLQKRIDKITVVNGAFVQEPGSWVDFATPIAHSQTVI